MSELNQGQQEALGRIGRWFRDGGREPFLLTGYAGTGKTFLMQTVLDKLNDKVVELIAPTAKAARVLSRRVGKSASTAHKLLYIPVTDERDRIIKRMGEVIRDNGEDDPEVAVLENRLKELERTDLAFVPKGVPLSADLIVVDEASMVGGRMADDLQETGVPLLLVGDPFQLPPVKSAWGFSDVPVGASLTDIVRVKSGFEGITEAATSLRLGEEMYSGAGFNLVAKGELSFDDYTAYDIVLCGTNKLRQRLNRGIRKALGFTAPLPEAGETLVCLANNEQFGLVNGETFKVVGEPTMKGRVLTLQVQGDGEDYPRTVRAWAPLFFDDTDKDMVPGGLGMLTFGYALTVHKAQGSEWDSVCVLDDWRGGDHDRWLYTAITRAAKHCTLVR